MLIGTATTVFGALHDHSRPFYHFFHTVPIKELAFDDVRTLFTKIVANPNALLEQRLRAVYVFTGGNPRMVKFMAETINSDGNVLNIINGLLDELTPYFDSMLKDLSDYQQLILNALAEFEPAQSPKEIAAHIESPPDNVRNAVKQLKDNGYLRVAFDSAKSNYYCLNEYLYRVWYQTRDSGHIDTARWLTDFLLILYGSEDALEQHDEISKMQQFHNDLIQPVLSQLDAGVYLKRFYDQDGKSALSKPEIGVILILMDKLDAVAVYLQDTLKTQTAKNQNIDTLVFTVKFAMLIKLIYGQNEELRSLINLYALYINSLNDAVKVNEHQRFMFDVFRLQAKGKTAAQNVRTLLERFRDIKGIPYDASLDHIWTALNDEKPIDSQRYMQDKAIAALVAGLKR
ncbi:ATPase [Candidatus Magnetoovum chiemensis]|nr:ATPase [Candidatus Magnetoovum chiemensis]